MGGSSLLSFVTEMTKMKDGKKMAKDGTAEARTRNSMCYQRQGKEIPFPVDHRRSNKISHRHSQELRHDYLEQMPPPCKYHEHQSKQQGNNSHYYCYPSATPIHDDIRCYNNNCMNSSAYSERNDQRCNMSATPTRHHHANISTVVPAQSESTFSQAKQNQSIQTKSMSWKRKMIEIIPGYEIPLHGTAETEFALSEGKVKSVTCIDCKQITLCVMDATLVICPFCHSISPATAAEGQKHHF